MIIGTLSHWYSFESAQRELSNEYQYGSVWKNQCFLLSVLPFGTDSVAGERVNLSLIYYRSLAHIGG